MSNPSPYELLKWYDDMADALGRPEERHLRKGNDIFKEKKVLISLDKIRDIVQEWTIKNDFKGITHGILMS